MYTILSLSTLYRSHKMTSKTMSMKLLIDRKTKRLLFAEAGKEVVDFLFSLLALPLGTVTELLTKENMSGSIGRLYKSVEELDINYFQLGEQQNKNILLHPSTLMVSPLKSTFLFASNFTAVFSPKYYQCSVCKGKPTFTGYTTYFTNVYKAKCKVYGCSGEMNKEIYLASPSSAGSEGLVKSMVMYTIMDDLSVVPMSSLSNLKTLDALNIKDLATLEEHVVKIGLEEGLKIVKASLQSKTVLTDVFLGVKVEPK